LNVILQISAESYKYELVLLKCISYFCCYSNQ